MSEMVSTGAMRSPMLEYRWPLLLGFYSFISLCAALCWGWSDAMMDIGGDGYGYMLAARLYSPFESIAPVLAAYREKIIYPPLFPFVVGIFGATPRVGNLVVAIAMWASAVAFYHWLRAEKIGRGFALSLSTLAALMPEIYLSALSLLTEHIYILFSFVAVLFVARSENESNRKAITLLLAASAVSAALLTRVAALPLLGAFVFYIVIRRPPHWLATLLVATVPFFVWIAWSQFDQVGIGGYTSQWKSKYPADKLAFFSQTVALGAAAFGSAWLDGVVGASASVTQKVLAILFGALGLIGLIHRLIKFRFDAIYFFAYLVMILAWPHPEEAGRYLLPLFMLTLGYGFLLLTTVAGQRAWSNRGRMQFVFLILIAIAVLPSTLRNGLRFLQPSPIDLPHAHRIVSWYVDEPVIALANAIYLHRLLAHMDEVGASVPDGECILSIKPTVLAWRTNRISVAPPKPQLNDEEFYKSLPDCKYGYALNFPSPSYPVPMYPLARENFNAKLISMQRFDFGERKIVIGILYEVK